MRGTEIGDDAVEGVVRDGFALRFLHPAIESLPETLAFELNGKIDQRSGAAISSRDGARLKIIGALGAAERHIEMRVNVDPAGEHEVTGGFEDAASVFDGKLSADGGNFVTVDSDVRDARIRRRHDCAVADYSVKTHLQASSFTKRQPLGFYFA